VRNDADESALSSTTRGGAGPPGGAGGGLCAELTVMHAVALEYLYSQVISSCPASDRRSMRAISAIGCRRAAKAAMTVHDQTYPDRLL
jgi:hypothetical protein